MNVQHKKTLQRVFDDPREIEAFTPDIICEIVRKNGSEIFTPATGWLVDNRAVGKAVRELRRSINGLSVRHVATAAGMSHTQLSELERGLKTWHKHTLASVVGYIMAAKANNMIASIEESQPEENNDY